MVKRILVWFLWKYLALCTKVGAIPSVRCNLSVAHTSVDGDQFRVWLRNACGKTFFEIHMDGEDLDFLMECRYQIECGTFTSEDE